MFEYKMSSSFTLRESSWKGYDTGDGKLRLYRKRKNIKQIKLITKFTRYELLRIAWNSDVTNPDGLNKSDCYFLGLDDDSGCFMQFLDSWDTTSNSQIINYIWNRLEETDNIKTP